MLVFARDESAIYHGDNRERFSLLLEETISDLISDQLLIVYNDIYSPHFSYLHLMLGSHKSRNWRW